MLILVMQVNTWWRYWQQCPKYIEMIALKDLLRLFRNNHVSKFKYVDLAYIVIVDILEIGIQL